MHHLLLADTKIENTQLEKWHIILDDNNKIIFLPLLWTTHLASTRSVFGWRTKGSFSNSSSRTHQRKPSWVEKKFESRPISDNTIDNYVGHLFHFLQYIDELHYKKGTPSSHNTELINSRFINHYLNQVLPQKLKSIDSITAHQAAISSYFNFLYHLEIKDYLSTTIHRSTQQKMAEKDDRPHKINYISRDDRNALLKACSTKRDKLILRMGFEVGLRTEENTGLILDTHKAKSKTHLGLHALFEELENHPNKHSFEFVLNGKYTKGGKTRMIYFDRELLEALKDYNATERAWIINQTGLSCPTLFVRSDQEGQGLPISAGQASRVFRETKNRLPHLNPQLSYHDLRHTFATELYHEELTDEEGRETRSESAALVVVAERLGHSNQASTKRYIRLRQQMLMIEEAV